MTAATELKTAQNLTSAEYLAERVKEAYKTFSAEQLTQLQTLYSSDIHFEDPAHAVQGKSALIEYFTRMSKNLKNCEFRFHSTITNGTDIFLSWTMFLKHPRLNNGDPIRVEGASYLRTRNGKIYYHRDYFDMGAMVYENVPLLGRLVRSLKQRLGR
jgi:predicted SnoaL-like aldol condensation-catalyzing enzyme